MILGTEEKIIEIIPKIENVKNQHFLSFFAKKLLQKRYFIVMIR